MKIFQYCGEIHDELFKEWYKAREFPAPNPHFLPPTGAVVYENETPICGGFMFQSDAGAAIMGHLVSNPEVSGELRNKGLDFMIEEFLDKAKAHGFKMVCCSTNLPKLMERFERHGFQKTDEGVSNFGRTL